MLPGLLLILAMGVSSVNAENWVSVGAAPKAATIGTPSSPVYNPSQQVPVVQTAGDSSGQNELISELLARIDQLQEQVSFLSGQLESQGHRIDRLEKNSETRYLDLDRRLSSMISSAPAVEAVSVESKAEDSGDQQAYRKAMSLLRNKEYDSAGSAFNDFISRYPDSDLLQNALYWSGAVASFQQDYGSALKRYKSVIDKFPDGLKAPDATYGYAVALHRSGDLEAARYWLKKVIEDYSDAQGNAVALAEDYLQRLDNVK